jgi:hypothetical protein
MLLFTSGKIPLFQRMPTGVNQWLLQAGPVPVHLQPLAVGQTRR